jgi:preprotein translocase subunit SecA
MVSRAIERAQNQVESQNFEIRKNVLKYDEVMDKQRKVIYEERRKILEGEDIHDRALQIVEDVVAGAVAEHAVEDLHPEEWDWEQLMARMREIYHTDLSAKDFDLEASDFNEIQEAFVDDALKVYAEREAQLGSEQLRRIERLVLLNVIDNRWREHLYEMDYLQEGIGLRGYGQRDPLVEYQREGYDMFIAMQNIIKEDFARYIFHVEVVKEDERQSARPMREERRQIPMAQATATPPPAEGQGGEVARDDEGIHVSQAISDKIPRNAPCPCGSGKKYKQCHGRPGAVASS